MEENDDDLSTMAVYIMMGVLAFVLVLVFAVLSFAHFKMAEWCGCKKRQVQQQQQQQAAVPNITATSAQNYTVVLEDHLHLVDSPEHSLDQEANAASRRPTTAASLVNRRVTPEKIGVAMEFMPDDNTILQVEGSGDKVTRITRTSITMEEKVRQTAHGVVHRGRLDAVPVSVHAFTLSKRAFDSAKRSIVEKDGAVGKLTAHPRFVRYHGTCFNAKKSEAYVITDFVAGSTLLELKRNPEVSELMALTEAEKVKAAADLADAVYFLHGHSKSVVHGSVDLSSVVIDGETHRAKLVAREAVDRIKELSRAKMNLPYPDHNLDNLDKLQEKAPEIILRLPDFVEEGGRPAAPFVSNEKSDMWSVGCVVLQLLFDFQVGVWDLTALTRQSHHHDSKTALKVALESNQEPKILSVLSGANPRLQFLSDCLSHRPEERPAIAFVTRGMQQCVLDIQRDSKNPSSQQHGSFLFPGRKISSSRLGDKLRGGGGKSDPLVKQQVEWNVKQDAGAKKRAVMFGNRNHLGRRFGCLSVTPENDVKDLSTMLSIGGYAMNNVYENLRSARHFEDVVKAYVAAVNKEPEEIDILLVYFSGLGVNGLPGRLARKRRLGIFVDRVGISHDLALATGDESLFPVAALQAAMAELNSKVRRKVIILDCRIAKSDTSAGDPFSATGGEDAVAVEESEVDWDVPTISEETLDRLTTMFTIYPTVEAGVTLAAVDSHPRRTNGFLTGCLINILKDFGRPAIEDLPRLLSDEMHAESSKAKVFGGISCKADFIELENDIWMMPFFAKN